MIRDMMDRYLYNVWAVLLDLAPWLLLGVLVASALHVFLPPGFIHRHLGRRSVGSVLKAVCLGVPMPLCSCSVIPTALGIRKEGASNGAAMGFMISTPQTGVDSILVSASFLGWPFALFKVAGALVTGIIGGLLSDAVDSNATTPAPAPVAPTAGSQPKLQRMAAYGIDDLLYMIWGWIVFGVLVSALITTAVPQNYFADSAIGSPILASLLALAVSLPLYVCATSSVPIAAALVQLGFPTGAALVFLMAGPATNMATVGAVYRGFGMRILAVYLGVIVVGSVGLSWMFDFVIGDTAVAMHQHATGGWLAPAAAVMLCILFGRFAVCDIRMRWRGADAGNGSVRLEVDGMTCKGCVHTLETQLLTIDGVTSVDTVLESGTVDVSGHDLVLSTVHAGVRAAGFVVRAS